MNKTPFLAVALSAMASLAVAGTSGHSFEQRCEREMTPQFAVSLADNGYRIVNNVSSRVLNNRGVRRHAGQLMLGMTAIETQTSVVFDGPALGHAASGRECVAPHISVQLVVPHMLVYVAREFAPESCSYRKVLEHELRHVQLYRAQFPALEARVRAGLAERFGSGPLYARHGAGLATLEKEVDQWLRPFIRREIARMEVAQAAIDTAEESHRLSSACLGELASNLGAAY